MGAPLAATSADACHGCEPAPRTVVKTNYRYNTVHQVRHVTQYRDVVRVNRVTRVQDVVRPRYVDVVHRTVNVTRVVPVTHVNVVTRVHPVTHVDTLTRVRDVTFVRHRHEHVGHVVYDGGRAVYGHSAVLMPGRTVLDPAYPPYYSRWRHCGGC
jgi:hypothetical protein